MTEFDINHCLKVLKYWHKVEFFQPFDLQSKFDNDKVTYKLFLNELKDERLPWTSSDALQMAGGNPGKLYSFRLYLGMFDKSAIKPLSEACFRGPQNENELIDWQEREQLDGSTCFASLLVDPMGIPSVKEISLSTLPWAIGHLKAKRLDELTYDAYESSVNRLFVALNRVFPYLAANSDQPVVPLTGAALQLLLKTLYSWADFSPLDDLPVMAIELFEKKQNIYRGTERSPVVNNTDRTALPEKTSSLTVKSEENDGAISSEKDSVTNINILNSFYIQDIEFIIQELQKGKRPDSLLRYLSGKTADRVDLFSSEGKKDILQRLHPENCNHGRWPSNDKHLMSLMQQYAINRGFAELSKSGLFSVNGPPGTGKTTMLRDMVADLMVKRALALSELENSRAAFSSNTKVTFSNGEISSISILQPQLTGFEILVASANNAAVENISKELPLLKELGEIYQDAGYLREVANKQLAEHGKDMIVGKLDAKKSAWGYMAVALGNKKNREKFVLRSITNSNGQSPYKIPEGVNYQTLWQWRDNYSGVSFKQAKLRFQQQYLRFKEEEQNYIEFVDLWAKLSKTSRNTYCSQETKLVQISKDKLKTQEDIFAQTKNDFVSPRKQLQRLEQEMASHQAIKPGWWNMFTNFSEWWEYRAQRKAYHKEHIQFIKKVRKIEAQFDKLGAKVNELKKTFLSAKNKLEKRQQEYNQFEHNFFKLKTRFSSSLTLDKSVDIKDISIQRAAIFQNSVLNELRSQLFVTAMSLHEAWLAEVLKKGGKFGGNLVAVSRLLSGSRISSKQDILPIWQSLFMIVPVISSTFASIMRQFQGVETEAFGWLFIDEAGQAIPQQAVGAMVRCKRVVVVGDPQQIEPVFTTPIALVEGLAKWVFDTDYAKWSPSVTSVQQLADEASTFGTYTMINEQNKWIGCPLRVHRRCYDPMFSIANRIAYDDTMVHALDQTIDVEDYLLGESGWIHVTGQAEGRQFVMAQAYVVSRIVEFAITQTQTLPNLYVITPFREIKEKLKHTLKTQTNLQLYGEYGRKYEKWVNDHVGTVHTFQGKEEETVIMVLGVDDKKSGAAAWASSKPNLLNVAVTRAKRRVYIVGDKQLWCRFQYFNEAARQLDTLDMEKIVSDGILF